MKVLWTVIQSYPLSNPPDTQSCHGPSPWPVIPLESWQSNLPIRCRGSPSLRIEAERVDIVECLHIENISASSCRCHISQDSIFLPSTKHFLHLPHTPLTQLIVALLGTIFPVGVILRDELVELLVPDHLLLVILLSPVAAVGAGTIQPPLHNVYGSPFLTLQALDGMLLLVHPADKHQPIQHQHDVIHLPGVLAHGATAGEIPDSPLLHMPCFGIVHGVHIADEGNTENVPGRDVLRGHHNQLPSLEDYRTVWCTRVVKNTGQQI